MNEIFKEGQQAYKDGLGSYENPYAGNTDQYVEWLQGWECEFYQWYHDQESDEWQSYSTEE